MRVRPAIRDSQVSLPPSSMETFLSMAARMQGEGGTQVWFGIVQADDSGGCEGLGEMRSEHVHTGAHCIRSLGHSSAASARLRAEGSSLEATRTPHPLGTAP